MGFHFSEKAKAAKWDTNTQTLCHVRVKESQARQVPSCHHEDTTGLGGGGGGIRVFRTQARDP